MRTLRAVLWVAAAVPAAATGQELAYAGSFHLASGSYIFTEPTHTYSLQNGLYLDVGRFRLGASVPLILQNSGAVTVVGAAALPTGGTGHGAVGQRSDGQPVPMGSGGGPNRSLRVPSPPVLMTLGAGSVTTAYVVQDSVVEGPGPYELSVGDPFLSAGLELYQGLGFVRSLELVLSAKAPLNDLESGVGTGEWDWGMGGSTALSAAGVFLFADATYWRYGDLPELELQDGISVGAGLGVPVSRSVWLSASAWRSNRIITTAAPASSVSAGLTVQRARASWSILVGTGLSETAAGFQVSLGWRTPLSG